MSQEPSVETVAVETGLVPRPLSDTAEQPCVFPETPFPAHLSLETLLEWWAREAEEEEHGLGETARRLLRELEAAPGLRGPRIDPAVLEDHRELVEALFTAVLPPGLTRLACAAVLPPFRMHYLKATPRFRRAFLDSRGGLRARLMAWGGMTFECLQAVFANLIVLFSVYQESIPLYNSPHLAVEDPETGLETYYQLRVHLEHVRVLPVGPPPPLDPEVLEALRKDVTDLGLWERLLPRDRFEFSGFMVHEATEVTSDVSLSLLKQQLMERDALENPERFRAVERCLHTLLRRPGVRLLVLLENGDTAWFLRPGGLQEIPREESCLDARSVRCFVGPPGRREGSGLVHLEALGTPDASPLQRALHDQGFRRAVLAPVLDGEDVLGYVIVASEDPEALSSLETLALRDVFPLFLLAVRNWNQVVRERIQSVMKEEFTAIHPTVEWRFRQAALEVLQPSGGPGRFRPIVFPLVHPLYGVSDIRSSSEIRLRSIQADMEDQLALARAFLDACYRSEPLPYLACLVGTVDRTLEELEREGLRSGQETSWMEFLRAEVEALFGTFSGDEVDRSVQRYREALDPDLGFVYRRRREFDESVARIRDRVGALLDEEQERAQRIFPHYFEMHKTDGVDHTIYVGASLTLRTGFRPVHLRSLRLWQLEAMVRVARETEALRSTLPLPLGTAHLVLAQEAPLTIRFMLDDRRFDVDGAYNARYEIVKKRLDKAEIHGTGERLTQPGHVAVVYSHPREASEYRDYWRFLAERGEIEPEVEDCVLGDLQGVQGLRALRVRVRERNRPA